MGFVEAIKTVFGKYAKFEGRARRSEFWWWALFLAVLQVIANLLDGVLGTNFNTGNGSQFGSIPLNAGWLTLVVLLVLVVPTIAVSVRRLHDTNRSGWWWWIGAICCIGQIILFIFYVTPGTVGENRFGPDPKGAAL